MGKIVEGKMTIGLPAFQMSGQARIKSCLAVQHLMTARKLSMQCEEIESENKGKEIAPIFFNDLCGFTSGAVILSVAAMEAYINEILNEPNKYFAELEDGVRDDLFKNLYKEREPVLLKRNPVLLKYEKCLMAMKAREFEKEEFPYDDASVLKDFRNELIHFSPEWSDEQERHKDLADTLDGRFELSPFIPKDSISFPKHFMSFGCSKWGVTTAYAFIKEFCLKTGLPFKFEKHEAIFEEE